jgi:iron(II)-dependent oxidoreductase
MRTLGSSRCLLPLYVAAALGAGCLERLDIDSVTYACEPDKAEAHCGKGWECIPGPAGFHVCRRVGSEPSEDAAAEQAPESDPNPSPETDAGPEARPKPEPVPEPAPEPQPEPTPEPQPESKPEPQPESKPEPSPESPPEPMSEPLLEPTAEVAEPSAEVAPEEPEVGPDAPPDAPPAATCGLYSWVCPAGFACTPEGTCENPVGDVYVQGGAFYMGCNLPMEPECADTEKPQHLVEVPSFAIGKTEVTVGMYEECVADTQCPVIDATVGVGLCNTSASPGGAFLPANCLDFDTAQKFCEFKKMRLCSEAEWEKAARGGCELFGSSPLACEVGTQIYPWGNQDPSCALAWYFPEQAAGACSAKPQPVGLLPDGASPYGAFDMAGNVAEWVADCYHDTYQGAPADGTAWTTACTKPGWRLLRGGSFLHAEGYLRAANRYPQVETEATHPHGARCCYSVAP